MNMLILKCPSCGAQLDFTSNMGRLECGYCGTEVLVQTGQTGQTNLPRTAPSTAYALDICARFHIIGPTDDQIREAVQNLDTRNDDAFIILSRTDDEYTYIQSTGDRRVGFDVEYQEGDLSKHFRATSLFDAAQMIAAFIAYRDGNDEWRRTHKWERIPL